MQAPVKMLWAILAPGHALAARDAFQGLRAPSSCLFACGVMNFWSYFLLVGWILLSLCLLIRAGFHLILLSDSFRGFRARGIIERSWIPCCGCSPSWCDPGDSSCGTGVSQNQQTEQIISTAFSYAQAFPESFLKTHPARPTDCFWFSWTLHCAILHSAG